MHSSIGHGDGAGGGLGYPSSDRRQPPKSTAPSSFTHNLITRHPTSKTGAETSIHLKFSALFALDGWSDEVTWAVGHDSIIRNVVILISAKRQPQRDDERCPLQMMMGILDILLRRALASFTATQAFLPLRNLGNHQTKHPTIICRAPMPHWCRFGLIFPTRSAVLGRISDARAQSALRKCEAFTTCQSSNIGKRLAERDKNLLTNSPAFVISVLFGHRH
ncbi:hypothetical protein Landi51_05914 [Colletotrichum acutatum]